MCISSALRLLQTGFGIRFNFSSSSRFVHFLVGPTSEKIINKTIHALDWRVCARALASTFEIQYTIYAAKSNEKLVFPNSYTVARAHRTQHATLGQVTVSRATKLYRINCSSHSPQTRLTVDTCEHTNRSLRVGAARTQNNTQKNGFD